MVGAFVGAASHVIIDAFTHEFRWGANLAHLNDVVLTLPAVGAMTEARVLQYLGHSLGSLVFVATLFFMASSGKLAAWYGESEVDEARQVEVSLWSRVVFWSVAVIPVIAAVSLAPSFDRSPLFAGVTASFVGIVVAGSLVAETEPADS